MSVEEIFATTSKSTPEIKVHADDSDVFPKWDTINSLYARNMTLFPAMWPTVVPGLQIGSFSLDGFLMACAPCGGHILLIRDPNYSTPLGSAVANDNIVPKARIFTCSGKLVSQFSVNTKNIKKVGWTEKDEIVIVDDEGLVTIHSIEGAKVNTFRIDDSSISEGIDDIHIHLTGLIVRTKPTSQGANLSCKILALTSFENPVPLTLGKIQLGDQIPTAMTTLSSYSNEFDQDDNSDINYKSSHEPGSDIVVLLGTNKGSIFEITSDSVRDLTAPRQTTSNQKQTLIASDRNPIVKIAVSYDNSFFGIYTKSSNNNSFNVSTYDCETYAKCLSFTFSSSILPRKMHLLSHNLVVLHYQQNYNSLILVVSSNDQYISYSYNSNIITALQPSSLLIIGEESCDILEQVNSCSQEALEHIITSISPSNSTILKDSHANPPSTALGTVVEAYRAYQADSPLAETFLDTILQSGNDGFNVLSQCIENALIASQHDHHHLVQHTLLSAASFGRSSLLSQYDTCFVEFPETCQMLRISNQLTTSEIGLPVSAYSIRNHIPITTILRRLCFQREHFLALKIAQSLKADVEPIIVHWSLIYLSTVSSTVPDAVIIENLFKKLQLVGKNGNVTTTSNSTNSRYKLNDLVELAAKLGRKNVVFKILELEPITIEVSKLLGMNEYSMALRRALYSYDADLIETVLTQCTQILPTKTLFSLIQETHNEYIKTMVKTDIVPYYVAVLRKKNDLETLKEFYFVSQQPYEAGLLLIEQAYRESNLRDRLIKFQSARELFLRDKDKDPWVLNSLDTQISLLNTEKQFAADQADPTIIDAPVTEMLEKFISRAQSSKASKLKQTFNISEKHYWHIEVRTLAKNGAWGELAQRASNRRSVPPIGYVPIIEACIANNAPREALKYIAFLQDPADQMTWYCSIGHFNEAADVAFKEKDPEALTTIRLRSGKNNAAIHSLVDKYLKQLG